MGMTQHTAEAETHGAVHRAETQFWFRPVHPLNWSAREVLIEMEEPAPRWPGVTRYVMAHVDTAGMLAVLVGFRPPGDGGSIDNVRCFKALVGPARDYPDPLATIGPLSAAAEQVEAECGGVLDKLYGHGPLKRTIDPVNSDPAAAHKRD
jgi:hypothetical protein